jgi:hypothetical protein
VQYVRALEAVVDWRQELLAIPRAARARRERRPDEADPRPATSSGGPMLKPATTLRVSVVRNGELVVQLSFKATAVAHLEDLVPADLGDRLRLRGINLARLADVAVAGGYAPGDLFTLADEDRAVRVWLD